MHRHVLLHGYIGWNNFQRQYNFGNYRDRDAVHVQFLLRRGLAGHSVAPPCRIRAIGHQNSCGIFGFSIELDLHLLGGSNNVRMPITSHSEIGRLTNSKANLNRKHWMEDVSLLCHLQCGLHSDHLFLL